MTAPSPEAPPAPATLWQIARRPKWIAALLLALAVAATFALLGQWQLERSFEGGEVTEEQTETVEPLTRITEPQAPVTSTVIGQVISADVTWVAGDWIVLEGRTNLAEPGYWVVGHALVSDGASLAVALGWAATAEEAASAIESLEDAPPGGQLTGRYLPSESPQESDFEAGIRSTLAVSELINLWGSVDTVYGGYVVSFDETTGLETIDAPPPNTEVSLNLLNVFYALEWVVFAGFAVYLWYRLVKDEYELQFEEPTDEPPVD